MLPTFGSVTDASPSLHHDGAYSKPGANRPLVKRNRISGGERNLSQAVDLYYKKHPVTFFSARRHSGNCP